MTKTPNYKIDPTPSAEKNNEATPRIENPVLARFLEERKKHFGRPQAQEPYKFLKRSALDARVLIIEGISGSGKDTFQSNLKKFFRGRDVYDYSEGEVLNSWKQIQIDGIFEIRIKFMKLFVNYARDIVGRDKNAVFLLNRFHLSAYVFTILQQPGLEREYEEIVNVLRTLPVHIFLLQLDENDIEKRSIHPERSGAWRKFQQQIAKEDGFRDKLDRYIRQQKIMLETAEKQQIPYSVIKIPSTSSAVEGAQVRVAETRSILRHGARIKAAER